VIEVGDVIGARFRIDRVIGVGGFGTVVAATHLELRTAVALKILKPEFVEDAEIVDRFLREARAVAGLHTDHVCRIMDVNRTPEGTPYIVMELLEGTDVGALIRRQPLPVATAVDYVLQALIALAEAHPRQIIHRDLKPPNLFVVGGSQMVKVLDFGIAKAADELRLTQSGIWLGSPQYMSPEQMMTPRDVDARTDIWSIAVTLYHMIAGALPFPSAQPAELAVMITSHPPRPLDCDPNLRAVIWRCLERDRNLRFADVGSLAQALAPFGGPHAQTYAAQVRTTTAPGLQPFPAVTRPQPAQPTVASVATVPTVSAPPPKRWVVGGAAILIAGGIAGYLAFGGSKAKPAPVAQPAVVAPVAPDAAVARVDVDAPPAVAVDAAVAMAPELGASLEEYEQGLLEIEDRIQRFANDPATVQASLNSAVQMSCALKQVARAKRYLERIVDKSLRDDAIRACKVLKIEL
jgi:hypothetical protein